MCSLVDRGFSEVKASNPVQSWTPMAAEISVDGETSVASFPVEKERDVLVASAHGRVLAALALALRCNGEEL